VLPKSNRSEIRVLRSTMRTALPVRSNKDEAIGAILRLSLVFE
jgi:hypothetical protein